MSQHTDCERNMGLTGTPVGRQGIWLCVKLITNSRTERKDVNFNLPLKTKMRHLTERLESP